jgi:hypothetical protein
MTTTTAFILFFYLWTPSNGGAVTTAEFTTEARCKDAAGAVADELGGMLLKPYWLCVPK